MPRPSSNRDGGQLNRVGGAVVLPAFSVKILTVGP